MTIVPVFDNCTRRLSSVRKDKQLRIRTGKTKVEARVRAVANRSQESAGRQGDQPRIRTCTGTGKTRINKGAGIRYGHSDRGPGVRRREGNQPGIRTGNASVEVRLRRKRTGARSPGNAVYGGYNLASQ